MKHPLHFYFQYLPLPIVSGSSNYLASFVFAWLFNPLSLPRGSQYDPLIALILLFLSWYLGLPVITFNRHFTAIQSNGGKEVTFAEEEMQLPLGREYSTKSSADQALSLFTGMEIKNKLSY